MCYGSRSRCDTTISQIVVEVDDWVNNNDTSFVFGVDVHGGLLENRMLMVGVHNNHRLHDCGRLVVSCHVDHWLNDWRVLGSVGD